MWETDWGRIKLMEKSASNSVKPRILFVLHLPPPVHGAAMMGQAIRKSGMVADAFDARFVNLSASASLSEVGRVSLKKLTFMSRLLKQVRKEVRDFRPDLVYLTPTSSGPGLIKDCLTARSIRKRGSKVVLHFHNKGVSVRQNRFPYGFLYRSLFKDAKVMLNEVRWAMSANSNTMKMGMNPETHEIYKTERVLDPIRVELDVSPYGGLAE